MGSPGIPRHTLWRRVFWVAAAAASMLGASSALADADDGTDSGDAAPATSELRPSSIKARTAGSATGAPITRVGAQTNGGSSTTLAAVAAPADAARFGFQGTGNQNFGTNTRPGINIFAIGDDNDTVANNNVVGEHNFPTIVTVLGNDNQFAAENNIEGDRNLVTNLILLGNDNQIAGRNNIIGDSDGNVNTNLAVLGNDNHTAGGNRISGDHNFVANLPLLHNSNVLSGGNSVDGNRNFVANLPVLGNNNMLSGVNVVQGNRNVAVNLAVLGDNNAESGENTLVGDGGFGANVALVGDDATGSGNNTGGGLNLVVVGRGSQNSANNTGGGINIAIVPRDSVDVGNCASALCINLFGLQLLGWSTSRSAFSSIGEVVGIGRRAGRAVHIAAASGRDTSSYLLFGVRPRAE